MAAPGQRSAKAKAALPPHYYEGFLEKKNPWDQDYKKYWAGLWGSTLYFYHTNRECQYIEKIDLTDLVSLAEDNCPRSVNPTSTEKPGLTLRMRNQEVKLRMESLEQQEMWKGFILTMVEMKIPESVSLLPGHLYRLSEALEKEQERRSNLSATLEREEKLPNCFFQVSRMEAVALLEQNENYGNMLLRPGQDGKSFSLTVRQKVHGAVSVKHYKINVVGGEYIIVMEKPNYCSSLMAVLDFFITKTKGILVPLSVEKSYAMALEVMETDQESEQSVSGSLLQTEDPQPPGKLVKQKSVESLNSWPSPPPPLPPIVPIPFPRRALAPQPIHVYEEEDPPQKTYVNKEGAAWDQPGDQEARWKGPPPPVRVPPKPPKKPPKPGSLLEGKSFPRHAITSTREKTPLFRSTTAEMTEELKRKLQERRARMEN
ncbi:signal-transducing adaptor protein 2 [Ahaetulla prasina]|uniref:signal-transducing adaptor protein 2 n=1 Tax=Ahaetulla prasina TaxID=499056 RepID=UPI002649491D|nr:signal-transducing adaptor protein 2 [Ahaetulla prasina]